MGERSCAVNRQVCVGWSGGHEFSICSDDGKCAAVERCDKYAPCAAMRWRFEKVTGFVSLEMSRKSERKINVHGPQTPLSRVGEAFADLELPGNLPEGPVDSAPDAESPSGGKGRVVLRREKAHRGGKTVIVVDDFANHLTNEFIESIASKLRSACGCGGTIRNRAIEVQGDQAGKVRAFLEREGFGVAGVR
jgi:translation initiation factor 1